MKPLSESWRAQRLLLTWTPVSLDLPVVTLGQVIDYLENDDAIDINVMALSLKVGALPTRSTERISAASLNYPIIVVKKGDQYKFVLDGNHRLQKAINLGAKSIKSKILDLDSPEIPEVFVKLFDPSLRTGERLKTLHRRAMR